MAWLVTLLVILCFLYGVLSLKAFAEIANADGLFADKKINKYTTNGFVYIVVTEKDGQGYVTELFAFNRMFAKNLGTIKFQKKSSCWIDSIMTHSRVCEKTKKFCLQRNSVRNPIVGKVYTLVSIGGVEGTPERVEVLNVYLKNKKVLVRSLYCKNTQLVWVSDLRKV